jgi:hypothetical protein
MSFWNIFGNMAVSDKGEMITHLSKDPSDLRALDNESDQSHLPTALRTQQRENLVKIWSLMAISRPPQCPPTLQA